MDDLTKTGPSRPGFCWGVTDLVRQAGKECRAQVTFSERRNYHGDQFVSVFRAFGDFKRCPQSCARRNADKQTFFFGGTLRGGEGIIIFDTDHFINDAGVQHIGHKTRADPLYRVRTFLAAREYG